MKTNNKHFESFLKCQSGKRCGFFLGCSTCAGIWRRHKFSEFCSALDLNYNKISNEDIFYIVIRPDFFGTLREKIEKIFLLVSEIREYRRNKKKLPFFYARLEISFKKSQLGFNPHLNIITTDKVFFKKIAQKFGLNFWSRKKNNDLNTIKSIVWYMLKFNRLDYEQARAVQITLNKRRTIMTSEHFKTKNIDYNYYIDTDFSFLGVMEIRSKDEVRLRNRVKKIRKNVNLFFKKELEKVKKKDKIISSGGGE